MSGLAIKYDGVFSEPGLPLLKNDPILTDSEGSLFLVDVKNWDAGVPANDALLKNIAHIQSRQLLEATEDDVAARFKQVGDLVGGGYGFIERTALGGLHVAPIQSAPIPQYQGFNIELPDAIMAYLVDNPDHDYYFSQWRLLTRPAAASDPDAAKTFAGIEASGAGGFLLLTQSSAQERPLTSNRNGRTILGSDRNEVGFCSFATDGPYTPGSSPEPTDAQYVSGLARSVAQFGTVNRQNAFSPLAAALQSWAFYRFYIEDRTVSGRSFAEVDAINTQLATEAGLAALGRFYDDSYTAPA